MLPVVPPAPDVAANQTRPQRRAFRRFATARTLARRRLIGALRVPAHGARIVFPVAYARGMKRVRAHRGHHAARLVVQPVQAHRTTRELRQRRLVVELRRGARLLGDGDAGGQLHAPHEEHAARIFAEGVEFAIVVVERERVRALLVHETQDHAVRRPGRGERRADDSARARSVVRGDGPVARLRVRLRGRVCRRSRAPRVDRRRDHAHLHHLGHERGDEAAEVADAERRRHGQDAHRGMPTSRERVRVVPDVPSRPGRRRGAGERVAE
mmetsp:Transcript_10643/g.45349  ORF Transcript_10643/g.45349 Transcript_10643/m.45349 type:complete len:269 (-) Transcript_10643:276-1082(-)